MNIYFAGTPNSAAEILNSLASNDLFNIMGVITQPDKRGKRGSKLIESPVSLIANSHKLKTYKPHKLSKEEIHSDLDITSADVLLVVAYGKLIPAGYLKAKLRQSIFTILYFQIIEAHPPYNHRFSIMIKKQA